MPRLTAAERHAAQQQPSYLAVPGPPIPHPLAKVPPHISSRPDIYLANGRTLVQPRLPPLLGPVGFDGRDANNGRVHATPAVDGEGSLDDRDIIAPERSPPPDPTQHRRKRAAQWQRWQGEVIPNLLHHFTRMLHETKSLREYDNLEAPSKSCDCPGRVLKVSIVRFSCTQRCSLLGNGVADFT